MAKIDTINDPNKAKDRYKITNWSEYNAGLKRRGSLTLWVDDKVSKQWYHNGPGKRGGQLIYSFTAVLGVFTYGMHTSLIEIQAVQNIYHLVTPELQSGASQDTHLPHLSSLQNIRIKRPDVDVLQR